MKKMFKLGAIVLAVALVLAGCGSRSDNQGAAPQQTGGSTGTSQPQGQTQGQSQGAAEDSYPKSPVTLIVPFSPGGSSDLLARAMAKVADKYLGQSLVVVNKPGGGATIGWNELAESKPDGYTIGITNISITLQPLYGGTKHNYPEALEPIAQAATIPVVLAVLADSPWQTLEDFVNYAKEHPGEIKYGHAGLGTTTHVAGELVAQEAGIKIEQVPFEGGSQALTAFLGGHVHALFANPPEVGEHVRSGKVRVLALTDEVRSKDPLYQDVPTFKEKGFDVVFTIWLGVGGPKGLPDNVKQKLAEAFKNIISDPEFVQSAQNLGMDVNYLSPEEFGQKWKSESERYEKLVKETGIAELIASQKN